jgi:hypothetical protein
MTSSQLSSGRYFAIKRVGIITSTNTLNKITNGKYLIAIIYPIYNGQGNREKPANCRGILLSLVSERMFSGILAGGLRDWLIYHKALSVSQMGFIKDKQTTHNVFVIKTTIDKYLRFKQGRLFWSFVYFEKAFDSLHREAVVQTEKKGNK